MIPNAHYEADVKYVLEQCHVVLRIIGICSLTDRQPKAIERLVNISLIVVCYCLVQCDLIPGILYHVLADDSAIEKAKMVSPILFSIIATAKYCTLIFHESDIRNCLRCIKEDWATIIVDDAREVMMMKATNSRRLFTLCCTFMYVGGLSYNTIMPLSRGSFVNDQNVTVRQLSFPGYYIFFDPQISPVYEIVFFQQCLAGFVMYTITVSICGLAALFVMHACAQMKILIRLIEDLVDCDDCELGQRNVDVKLAVIVKHQIRIRSFLRLVESTLCYSSLVELLGCTIIICLVGYCTIAEWEDRNMTGLYSYVIALVSVTLNIFILCFIGEYITIQADEVSLTMCTFNWYRLPTSRMRSMVLLIAASNVPQHITAGKFVDLSFRTFGNVIKSAVVYLNMLQQLTE